MQKLIQTLCHYITFPAYLDTVDNGVLMTVLGELACSDNLPSSSKETISLGLLFSAAGCRSSIVFHFRFFFFFLRILSHLECRTFFPGVNLLTSSDSGAWREGVAPEGA